MYLIRLALVLGLVVLPAGCVTYGETRDIEPEYRPLKTLSERPDMILSDTAATTVGEIVYVADLDKWLNDHPVGTPRYHATMVHEQEHSKRQHAQGTLKWVSRYLVDKDFMWAEEQRGWYLQLKALKAAGFTINVDGTANSLHNYKTLTGSSMVGREEAKQWILSVLNGQWTPPP